MQSLRQTQSLRLWNTIAKILRNIFQEKKTNSAFYIKNSVPKMRNFKVLVLNMKDAEILRSREFRLELILV